MIRMLILALRRIYPVAAALLLILVVLPADAQAPTEIRTAAGYPTVHFDYHFVPFDRACTQLTEQEIPDEWIGELERKLDSFRGYWAEEGPRLLSIVVDEVGKPFRERDMTAVMSLCKFPSMSHPLLLNMRRFLEAPTEGRPHSMEMFGALVLHELLHIYVDDILGVSPFHEKYKDEPGSVRSHIHLMALMKTVYGKLGRRTVVDQIVAKDANRPIYARAWEIVNKLEGAEALVAELRRP